MEQHPPDNPTSREQRQPEERREELVFLERGGKIVFANAEARQLLGLTAGEWVARPIEDLLWDASGNIAMALVPGTGKSFRATIPARNGRLYQVEGIYTPVSGNPREGIIVAHPTGPARGARERLVDQVLASLPEAVAIEHSDVILHINPAFTSMFGYTAEDANGRAMQQLVVPETRFNEHVMLLKAVNEQGEAQIETVRVNKSGELIDVSLQISPLIVDGNPVGYVYTFRDIAERKETEARLQHDAMHDVLTGLPNRALFQDRLTLALNRRVRRPDQSCGVLYLDLDRFKEINDTLGHAAGDVLLKAVAERLTTALRPQDSAARLGGDEFAVLVESISSAADLEIVGNRVLKALHQPIDVFGHLVRAGASIGAAMAAPEHTVAELLIRDADYAMYRAKQTGGSRIEIYDRHLEICVSSQQERERELRTILENRLFEFWYQPIFRLTDGKLEGFETSLSWRRADGTVENSGELMALAEEIGLSVVLAREMLEAACMQLRNWADRFPQSDFYLSVNLTSRQFYHDELITQLRHALSSTGTDPLRLVLEIPETVLNESPDTSVGILQRMLDCGVHVAMDEFGSGLAPLNHLLRLPLDMLKLDGKLIAALNVSGRQQSILDTLVRLSNSLGVRVVAQGIEAPEQLSALLHMGCFAGQGPMLAGPMDESRALKLVGTRHSVAHPR
jgi:Amt family ammonium transporter